MIDRYLVEKCELLKSIRLVSADIKNYDKWPKLFFLKTATLDMLNGRYSSDILVEVPIKFCNICRETLMKLYGSESYLVSMSCKRDCY